MIYKPFPKKFLKDTITIFNPYQVLNERNAESGFEAYKGFYTATIIRNCYFSDANNYTFNRAGITSGDNISIYIDNTFSTFEKIFSGTTKSVSYKTPEEWSLLNVASQQNTYFTLTKNMKLIKGEHSSFKVAKIDGKTLNIADVAKLGFKLFTTSLCDVADDSGEIHSFRLG